MLSFVDCGTTMMQRPFPKMAAAPELILIPYVKVVSGLGLSVVLLSRLSVTPPSGSLFSSLLLISLSGLCGLCQVRVVVFLLMSPICISIE